MYDPVDRCARFFERPIEGFSLDKRTGKAVEQYTRRIVDLLLDHLDNVRIGNQVAPVHKALRQQSQSCARCHFRTEHIAG